jgi:hypothetical protein
MSDAETLLNLKTDEDEVVKFLAENGGRLDRDKADAAIYWLTLRPRADPNEGYVVRVAWHSYPHRPPSVKFADAIGGSLTTTSAWPVIAAYRPASYDICKPFTAEGFALHPDWESGPQAWRTNGNPFLWIVQTLQSDLGDGYAGRSA